MSTRIKIEIHTSEGPLLFEECATLDEAIVWLNRLKEILSKEV